MKNKKKVIRYAVLAAIIIAAVIYFIINPVSADKLAEIFKKNDPRAAAVLLLLFAVKGFVPIILYMVLTAACGLLFDLPYAILIASVGTVINLSVSYIIGKTAKSDVSDLIERHEKLKKYYTKGEKYSFVFCLALHSVGLQSELLGTFFGSLGMPYIPYIVSSVIGILPGAAMWIVLGGKNVNISWYDLFPFAIDLLMIGASLLYLKKRERKNGSSEKPDKEIQK